MALFLCPDCGREVSTRAVLCPQCGCPLTGDNQVDRCALVLLKGDPDDTRLCARIQAISGCSDLEAANLCAGTPAVLQRGLPYRDCAALTESFTAQTVLGVVPDGTADDPRQLSKALPLQREAYAPPRHLGFGAMLGAVILGLFLWTLLLILFQIL